MIRLFTALCKAYLKKISDEERLFREATGEFCPHAAKCPRCGAVGNLAFYCDYTRNLTSHEGGRIVDRQVSPHRYECRACGRTHALLPDIIIPYSPYSLVFKLAVLIAYYERTVTVTELCAAFGIAVSTLYDWKALMLEHKDLMLGLFMSLKVPAPGFLRGLSGSVRLSERLRDFFRRHAFSFLERPKPATRPRPP